jgi:Ca2+-binding EF-hand superfamily protein
MRVLDLDGDGIISVDELRSAAQLLKKGEPVE